MTGKGQVLPFPTPNCVSAIPPKAVIRLDKADITPVTSDMGYEFKRSCAPEDGMAVSRQKRSSRTARTTRTYPQLISVLKPLEMNRVTDQKSGALASGTFVVNPPNSLCGFSEQIYSVHGLKARRYVLVADHAVVKTFGSSTVN